MYSKGRFVSILIGFLLFFVVICFAVTGSGLAEVLELDSQVGTAGADMVFTVSVNNTPNDAAAFGFDIYFDHTRLDYQSIARGALSAAFLMVLENEYEPGKLRIGFIAGPLPGDVLAAGTTGELVTITFKDITCLPTALEFQNLVDHIVGWSTKNGGYTCVGDGDGDGIPNDTDNCPEVSNPAQTDTDSDGAGDVCDNCPDDPGKLEPGVCGCGFAETDIDGDGRLDCVDDCPGDPGKTAPGVCGCGTPDTDTDGDGTPDCLDDCPDDPGKTLPGVCGCGTADTDTDGDSVPDCHDDCPDDPGKTAPGVCGCGTPDTDSDGDGIFDCNDKDDSDNDGIKDKQDNCPAVANPDQADADRDGFGDVCDECPQDPGKTVPGKCGCGVADTDSDGDGTADCADACPANPDKIAPGVCGCKKPDLDRDGDGDVDCHGGGGTSTLEDLFGCFIDTLGR